MSYHIKTVDEWTSAKSAPPQQAQFKVEAIASWDGVGRVILTQTSSAFGSYTDTRTVSIKMDLLAARRALNAIEDAINAAEELEDSNNKTPAKALKPRGTCGTCAHWTEIKDGRHLGHCELGGGSDCLGPLPVGRNYKCDLIPSRYERLNQPE